MDTNKLKYKEYMHYRNKLNALHFMPSMMFAIKKKKNIDNNIMRTKTLLVINEYKINKSMITFYLNLNNIVNQNNRNMIFDLILNKQLKHIFVHWVPIKHHIIVNIFKVILKIKSG